MKHFLAVPCKGDLMSIYCAWQEVNLGYSLARASYHGWNIQWQFLPTAAKTNILNLTGRLCWCWGQQEKCTEHSWLLIQKVLGQEAFSLLVKWLEVVFSCKHSLIKAAGIRVFQKAYFWPCFFLPVSQRFLPWDTTKKKKSSVLTIFNRNCQGNLERCNYLCRHLFRRLELAHLLYRTWSAVKSLHFHLRFLCIHME